MKSSLGFVTLTSLFAFGLCSPSNAQESAPIVRVSEPTIMCGQEFIYPNQDTRFDVPCQYFEVTESLSSINFHFAAPNSHLLTFISTDRVNGSIVQEFGLVAVIMREAETMELISENYLDGVSSGKCLWNQVDKSVVCLTDMRDASGGSEINALADY
jgi:hypothetical protein